MIRRAVAEFNTTAAFKFDLTIVMPCCVSRGVLHIWHFTKTCGKCYKSIPARHRAKLLPFVLTSVHQMKVFNSFRNSPFYWCRRNLAAIKPIEITGASLPTIKSHIITSCLLFTPKVQKNENSIKNVPDPIFLPPHKRKKWWSGHTRLPPHLMIKGWQTVFSETFSVSNHLHTGYSMNSLHI